MTSLLSQPATVPSQRVASLDFLRSIAIFLVLGRHMNVGTGEDGVWLHRVTAIWERGGWIGVDLFFVLSGFLISGLLFREFQRYGKIDLRRFFIRRGLKIYPPFYFFIFVSIIARAVRGAPLPTRDILGDLLFLQNYLGTNAGHTWSLAVEEHFYVLLPLVMILLIWGSRSLTDPFRGLSLFFAVLAPGLLILRIANAHYRGHFSYETHINPTHLRIDSLMFGVICSYWFYFHREQVVTVVAPRARSLMALGVVLLGPAFIFDLESSPFNYTLGLTMFYLGSGALLMGLVVKERDRGRFFNLVSLIGAYSYSIYLWHIAVRSWGIFLLEKAFNVSLSNNVSAVVYLVGSIVIGIIMAKLVEYPVLRIRDRLFPSRSGSILVGAGPSGTSTSLALRPEPASKPQGVEA